MTAISSRRSIALAFGTGALFALGLVVSGMTTPAKVTGFLDVFGHWDPSLAFVMAGAILAHAPIVRLVRGRSAPMFDTRFHWPTVRAIEPALVIGSALFGIGWGLSGYCPGPGLVSLIGGAPSAVVFVAAMIAGIAITRVVRGRADRADD
jgi:uncharacterized membrane protein YedE/YeeE